MERSKDTFRAFIVEACRSRTGMVYKELYSHLLQCFMEADTDCEGRIGAEAFDTLVDVAARAPKSSVSRLQPKRPSSLQMRE